MSPYRKFRVILLEALAIVALGLLPTQAAASITDITVSAEPVTAGIPVYITLEGDGYCSPGQLDFGDGMPIPFRRLPRTFKHTYGLPSGTKTIRAKCGEDEASHTVNVKPGGITGLTVSPNPVAIVEPALITVQGAGECAQLQVSFGDGLSTVLQSIRLPQSVQHTYTLADVGTTRTISAVGLSDCGGSESATVAVVSDIGPPRIDGVLGAITPGGSVSVQGANFRITPGTVSLRGVDNLGSRDVSLTLNVLSWGDNRLIVTIPVDVTGVVDQHAVITVYPGAPSGRASNPYDVFFKAAREVILLPADRAKAYVTVSCDIGSVAASSRCSVDPRDAISGTQISARHSAGLKYGDVVDVYTISLPSGWEVDRFVYYKDLTPQTPTPGGPQNPFLLAVYSSLDIPFFSTVIYYGAIYVSGPRGIPFP